MIEKYENKPEELNYPSETDLQVGIFDAGVIKDYKKYSR